MLEGETHAHGTGGQSSRLRAHFYVEGSVGSCTQSSEQLFSEPTEGRMWGTNSWLVVKGLG